MKNKSHPIISIFKFFFAFLSWVIKFFYTLFLIISTLLLVVCVVLFIDYLIPDDYCFEQHRKLTDKEYILIILDKFLKEGRIKVHDEDNTADSYLLHHPDCCEVFRNEHTGYYDDGQEVIIRYELSYKFKELERTTHYTSVTLVSACGWPVKFYGTSGRF